MTVINYPTWSSYMLLEEVKAYNEKENLNLAVRGTDLVQMNGEMYLPTNILSNQIGLQVWKKMEAGLVTYFF